MRGPFGALLRNFNTLGFHTHAHFVGVVRGVWALNILVRHIIVSPWFMAFSYSESICMFCGWGGGWGFIPCFSLTLSPSSCTFQAFGVSWFDGRGSCLYACVCVRGTFGALLRIFNILGVPQSTPMLTLRGWCGVYGFLTYLLAIPLFPHAPWPSHTLCFFFPSSCTSRCLVSMEEWGCGCGSCLYACFMTCVVLRCFFLRVVLSLCGPPSQHTWFPHLRMCSGGNVGCMGS